MSHRGNWIDDDEYPDDSDMERFGEYSASDYDPLTIGRVGRRRGPFWTRTRVVLAIIVIVLVMSILIVEILPLLDR